MIAVTVPIALLLIAAVALVLFRRRARRRLKSEPHQRIDLFHRD